MSKSAKEVLLDYKRKVKHISDDINFLINTIKMIIASCEKIDNSDIYHEELNMLLKRLNEKQFELNTNALDKKISKDVHTATETLKEINSYLNRQVDDVALIKQAALEIKAKVIKSEIEQTQINLKNNTYNSFREAVDKVLDSINDAESYNFLKKYVEENQNTLINVGLNSIQAHLLQQAADFVVKPQSILSRVVNFQLEQFKDDPDLMDIIKANSKEVELSINENSTSEKIKAFLNETEHQIASEVIRKEVIIKIIQAIRNVGFVVNKSDVVRAKMGNKVMILAQKPTGETAQFAVDLDGSYIYNFEGYEGKEHDYDTDDFIQKLRDFGLATSEEFQTVYRKPNFVAKKESAIQNVNNKKKTK
ncbi:hypothetical protein [Spiroplasma endosymbiont of Panorpa germanica]|uniref:hypothetical protein n=1 Tax=Spiroplasma endosymbiont of Panorpa germanica TaxID=3066314 RepID=UPI0030CD4304